MNILATSRVAIRVNGNRFVSFQDDGTVVIRDNPNTPGIPGAFETVEVLLLDDLHGPITPPVVPPVLQMPGTQADPPEERFQQLVQGLPFGQATLLSLEPVLNAAGWALTPANAAGDRTKIHPPGGPWTRVGFGEGKWVWIPQTEQ